MDSYAEETKHAFIPNANISVDAALDLGPAPISRFFLLMLGAALVSSTLLLVFPLKAVLVCFIVATAVSGAVSVPLNYSLHVILFYFLFEGMVKLLTNYHPILHVSGDILVLLFAVRSFVDKASGGFAKVAETPHLPLFLLFAFWVLVQFFNPYSLGILPSLAGLKIYLVPPVILYLAYHHVEREQLTHLSLFIIATTTVMATLAIVEYIWGQRFMMNLSPAYVRATRDVFVDSYYRPFGTTNLPGKPATWVSLAAPFATYLLFQTRVNVPKWQRLTCVAFFFVSAPLLLICQTRLAMLQTALGVFLVLAFNKKALLPRILIVATVTFFVASPLVYRLALSITQKDTLSATQIKVISTRVESLARKDLYTTARENPLPRIWADMQKFYLFGLGLSRVGAAAGPWKERIENHPYFHDERVGWADNLLIALFHEVGILGMFTYLFLYFRILGALFASGRHRDRQYDRGCDYFFVWMCFSVTVLILISGAAAEGALYSPVSIFLWLCFGLGLKEVAHARA